MLKARISKNGITREYHFEGKIAEWFDKDGTYKGDFYIENELEGLKEIINTNIGCTIDMIEEK